MCKLKRDEEEKKELIEKFTNLNSNRKIKFMMEPQDTNILQCYQWDIDTWLYWIIEEKRVGANIFCLKCATKNAKYLSETNNKVGFYYKYEREEIQNFFKRLEHRIKSPTNFDTWFPQTQILLKDAWPDVKTKQNLEEENEKESQLNNGNTSGERQPKLIKVNYYGNSGNNDFKA